MTLNLVDPSLFCGVYGQTLSWRTHTDGTRNLEPLPCPPVRISEFAPWSYSDRSYWIPTTFQLGKHGESAKALGYINNVHPEYCKALVEVIEDLVGRFSLLWDKVLTDMLKSNQETLPCRNRVVGKHRWVETEGQPPIPNWKDYSPDSEKYWKAYDLWKTARTIILPTVDSEGYRLSDKSVAYRKHGYSIQGTKVQVVVKLMNIQLVSDPASRSY